MKKLEFRTRLPTLIVAQRHHSSSEREALSDVERRLALMLDDRTRRTTRRSVNKFR